MGSREGLVSTVASVSHHQPVTKAAEPVLAVDRFIVTADDDGLEVTTTDTYKSKEVTSQMESDSVSSTVLTLLESVSLSNISDTEVNNVSHNLTKSDGEPKVASFWYPTLDAIDVIMLAISVMEKILLVGRSNTLFG